MELCFQPSIWLYGISVEYRLGQKLHNDGITNNDRPTLVSGVGPLLSSSDDTH